MNYNDGYDAYYEDQANAAEAEAQHEQDYQDHLDKLLENGEAALFAAYVALDWLHSKEFSDSGLSALDFITKQKEKLKIKSRLNEPF